MSCEGLVSMELPQNVTYVGSCAFGWCANLEELYLPGDIASFGFEPFIDCENLVIKVPKGSQSERYLLENGYSVISR